ncbi:MAG: tyrosine-type recombinase/integrase [Lachnospiraceae bacterium]|nr:tyrosine-type recombinase/integrase [Lachnospiraceae bacterium]
MNIAQPIKQTDDLNNFKKYYKKIQPNGRNSLLIVMGLNTALRISDILPLKWEDVYDFERGAYRSHISLTEQKTGKRTAIYLNESIIQELNEYWSVVEEKKGAVKKGFFLFGHSNKNVPITRVQAFRIIRRAAECSNISGVISCHSLRKTFGYHAWKQGAEPALLVNIYNHSTYQVTKRYLGIEQDDRDQIFKSVTL